MNNLVTALLVLIVGTVYAFVMRIYTGQSGHVDLDGAGIIYLVTKYATIPLLVIILALKREKLKIKTIHCRIVFLLSIINSSLLCIWNYSLTDAYLILSISLSLIAACMYYKRL